MPRIGCLLFFCAIVPTVSAQPGEKPLDLGTVTERHEMVPMRDGTKLSTYLYFPAGKGPWPVLYEQRYADLRGAETRKSFAKLAEAGYVVAGQNFRGTYKSEGTWAGYRALGWGEQKDGYDSVEWLAKQPWSTGKVGTFGSSQAGFAQNFLAVTRPPHLVCQYMIDTGLSLFHEGYRIGGTTRPERFKQMDAVCREPKQNRALLEEWFRHPTYDAYWAEEDCTRFFDKMNVPCFTIGSWYDFMCVGSVDSFLGRQHKGGEDSRGKQQLLIGPWLHGRYKESNKIGDLTYPENAKHATEAHMIRWFDHHLKGVDNGAERDPTVRYYVMGAIGEKDAPGNVWRTSPTWPVAAQATSYYLHKEGNLTLTAPTEAESRTTFLADPLKPNEIPGRAFPGAKDARPFEKQPEVRTFTSEVLTEPVEWTGKVQAELYVSSSAKDTDFIVRISDVYPDGRSILLMDYVRRARYREGYEKEVMMEAGKVYKVAFDVGWTSQIFNKGHRIRVTVASTGAPFYEMNPNTGEALTIEMPEKTMVAKNAVHHERGHASRILAPVKPMGLPEKDRKEIERGLKELNERLKKLPRTSLEDRLQGIDALADAEVFAKGVTWALRYDTDFTAADIALLKKALARGKERVSALEAGKKPWAKKKGKVVRGLTSQVDGSIQPYGIVVPANYDPKKPMRLDVILHGSTRPVGMSELRFMDRFDEGDESEKGAPEQGFIEVRPLGRVENGYRWAGKEDVYEAISAATTNYKCNSHRVLRGMSMGASGTWHLGLKDPGFFTALGPYCGYVDTHEFSKTPLPGFVKVGSLPAHQEKMLHLLDAVDYAANARMVPCVACMGEKDVFFQAHVLMKQAMEKEGLKMVNLIAPGTGHVVDPVTHKEQMRRIADEVAKQNGNVLRAPRHVRFVTWSLMYSGCNWLHILGMEQHYARAELEGRIADDGSVDIVEPKNVTRFAILTDFPQRPASPVRIGGKVVPVPAEAIRNATRTTLTTVFAKRGDKWVCLGELEDLQLDGKLPGLQGPIDDAFTSRFLCVRGTGQPLNPKVQAWSEANLQRFAYEWHRYFRGELPIKNDTDVTDEDVRSCNLILFGDPGSNRWIGKVLPQLPLRWTKEELEFGGGKYAAADHVPVLIQPNPLAKNRYVVLNSGHTFHEKELASLNYLLFPRLGDWAVLKVGVGKIDGASPPLQETVLRAGFFDEKWRGSK